MGCEHEDRSVAREVFARAPEFGSMLLARADENAASLLLAAPHARHRMREHRLRLKLLLALRAAAAAEGAAARQLAIVLLKRGLHRRVHVANLDVSTAVPQRLALHAVLPARFEVDAQRSALDVQVQQDADAWTQMQEMIG